MCLNKKLNREFTHTEWEIFVFDKGQICVKPDLIRQEPTKQESQNARHQETCHRLPDTP